MYCGMLCSAVLSAVLCCACGAVQCYPVGCRLCFVLEAFGSGHETRVISLSRLIAEVLRFHTHGLRSMNGDEVVYGVPNAVAVAVHKFNALVCPQWF